MLNLLNILTLTTALTTNYITSTINISINKEEEKVIVDTNLKSEKEYAYSMYFISTEGNKILQYDSNKYSATYEYPTSIQTRTKNILIGWTISQKEQTDIYKYKDYNEYSTQNITITYYNVLKLDVNNTSNSIKLNISIKENPMEELLTALTTAVQSAVSIFVEGFGGLTQIFYNGTEITFIGGILIVGLAVMFLMMFLRWIVSFVKGI